MDIRQQKQILVVEDNELNREMLCAILSDSYQVLEAENGQAALDILAQTEAEIDLILLDISMPVMDGYTFLDISQKDEQFSSIPVIVMTQENSEEEEIAALEHGATDFLPKPYRPRVILHRVASLIKLRDTAAMANKFQYDELTGLYSRNYFYRKVRQRLDRNPDKEYMILCSNLENFKLYNDTFGRKAGDQLLLDSAVIFQKRVGPDAICCRYNADRFICLIDKEVEKLGRKKFADGRKNKRSELRANISVKLGIYEITDRSISVEQMCDRALLAVDSIKGLYHQHLAVYDDTLREKLLREKEITDIMETALEQEQFVVYFQPKYSLHDNCMVGAEALVRWVHPELGFMSPGEFIPLFEKNGFIIKLDEYMWEEACKAIQGWHREGRKRFPVSVNVSRYHIHNHRIEKILQNLLDRYELTPQDLSLEITETMFFGNASELYSLLQRLQDMGFRLEVDDFGAGYSSLNMLRNIPADVIKIDKSFLDDTLTSEKGKIVIRHTIAMAKELQLQIIAEGVETMEHVDFLRNSKCDVAQGFYFAKPMPLDEFNKLNF